MILLPVDEAGGKLGLRGGSCARDLLPAMSKTWAVSAWSLTVVAAASLPAYAGQADRAHERYALSAETRLILVPVTVTDRNGRNALNLQQSQFRIFDNAEPREIVSYAREEAPVTLGIVVDLSGSMERKLPHAVAAVRAVTDRLGSGDEGFLVAFSGHVELRQDLTSDLASFAHALQFERGHGSTALIDAVYMGLEKAMRRPGRRKAILVISDGGDNASRYREPELLSLAREAGTQIYAISIHENAMNKEEREGMFLLDDLAKTTGGLHLTARNKLELPELAGRIAQAMKNVYVIGYRPPKSEPGRWRQIRVVLTDDVKKSMRVTARSGYYSPE